MSQGVLRVDSRAFFHHTHSAEAIDARYYRSLVPRGAHTGRHQLEIVSPLRTDRDPDDPERRHIIPFWK